MIDIHVHAFMFATPEQLMDMLKPKGVGKAVILPTVNPDGSHVVQGVEQCLAIAEKHPDFFITFMTELQDRLLFGTDICDPRNETPLVDFMNEALHKGHLSREVFDKIAWKNAARLLGLNFRGHRPSHNVLSS